MNSTFPHLNQVPLRLGFSAVPSIIKKQPECTYVYRKNDIVSLCYKTV